MEVEGEYYKPMEAIEWTPEDNEAIYKHQFKYAKYPATRALPENGFRLEAAEGSVFPVTDPMQLHAFFASKVTPEMKAFLDQDCLIEQNEQAVSDGGFIIPLEQILDRCVFWEKFNATYPNFILSDQTKQSESWMRTTFVSGMNNTPVFDYETDAVTEDYLKVWAYSQQKYPDTKVGALIKEFSTLVVSEGNKRTPKVDDYINKVVLLE